MCPLCLSNSGFRFKGLSLDVIGFWDFGIGLRLTCVNVVCPILGLGLGFRFRGFMVRVRLKCVRP